MDKRMQDFEARRAKLKGMSDDQLKDRFWQLCAKVVEPMAELSKSHTSPSIERSVLMRMGLDSFTAAGVVSKVTEAGLLGKGAGNAVLQASRKLGLPLADAAKRIIEAPDVLKGLL